MAEEKKKAEKPEEKKAEKPSEKKEEPKAEAKKAEKKEPEKTEEKKAEKPEEKKAEKPEEKKAEAAKPAEVRKPRKRRFAVVHVYSSKNDTIITATDLSGAETLAWASGGMVVKSHREEGRPYAAMQAALRVVNSLKDKGITNVSVKIRAPGGVGPKTPGSGAQAVVRTIARTGVRIGRIEDITPLPTDSMKRKGGRRGRRV
jgi:small subunit ribosomal protein S11